MNDYRTKPAPASALDRRMLLGAAMASGALLAAPGAASAALLDINDPASARAIIRKLRYRTDEGAVFWWIKGDYFADVDGALTPLYGLAFGVIEYVTQRADGGFDIKQMEMGFRTDLETGKRLSSYRNPLTGETLPVPFNPIGPTLVHYSPDAVPSVPKNLGGSQLDFQPMPEKPVLIGDQVFLSARAASRVKTPGVLDRIINDISMIHGPASQALDPACTMVDSWVHSSDVTSWPRWMKMEGRPGSLTLRGVGGKVRRMSDMPQDLLAMLEAHDPAIVADPMKALERPPATYRG